MVLMTCMNDGVQLMMTNMMAMRMLTRPLTTIWINVGEHDDDEEDEIGQ